MDRRFQKQYDKCEVIARQFKRIYDAVNSETFPNKDLHEVTLLVSELDNYWSRYQALDMNATLAFNMEDPKYEEALSDAKETVTRMVIDSKRALSDRIEEMRVPASQQIKPSEVQLEKFNGDRSKWPAWKAQFMGKVYETKYTPIVKLDLLLKSLTDGAADSAGTSELKDPEDLDRIWEKMCRVYDNRYLLTSFNIDKLLDIPSMDRRHGEGIRKLVDVTEEQLRILKRFDCETDYWSPLVFRILFRKLDKITQREWERRRSDEALPCLKQLLAFLERECQTIANEHASNSVTNVNKETESRKRSGPSTDQHRPAKSFRFTLERSNTTSNDEIHHGRSNDKQHKRWNEGQARLSAIPNAPGGAKPAKTSFPQNPGSKAKCWHCSKENHRLSDCRAFAKITAEERKAWAESKNRCTNCFSADHQVNQCTRDGCRSCGNEKHHKALCPKQMVFQTKIATLPRRTAAKSRRPKKE